MQQRAGHRARLIARDLLDEERLGHHVEARDAGNGAQELTDIAHGVFAQGQNLPWFGRGDIRHRISVAQQNATVVAAITAKDHFQDR